MKRFICAMLTLIMLVGMLPMTTANAASKATSGAAITVLKTMASYKGDCYQVADTKEFRIGYGTICKEKHVFDADGKWNGESHYIKEAVADTRLREQLKEMDKKVNDFASANSLSLKQNQFDALVVFSYLNGTAWMSGNGVVKTAVKNNAGAAELLKALNDVSLYGDYENRNKVIVNMYSNNVYSDAVPGNYATVCYNANGGHIPESGSSFYDMLFDTTVTGKHPVPTRNGYKFLGWYLNGFDGKDGIGRVANLISGCADKTLEALWQSADTTYANATAKNPDVKFTLKKSQLASATIFDKPDVKEGKAVGTFEGEQTVVREFIGADGSRWAKIAGSEQWVLTSAGSNGTGSSNAIRVKVTNDYVNCRKNADVHSAKKGSYQKGTELYILATKNADGFLWGQVAAGKDDHTPVGWVALRYTNWNSVKDEGGNSSDNGGASASNVVATAYITFNGYVNVRSGAGTNGTRIIGSLAHGESVDVYEIKTVNGHRWGRTDAGWFCMTYANVTMTGNDPVNNDDVSNEGALAYTFSGKLTEDVETYVNTSEADKTKYQPKAGTDVSITNIAIPYANGNTNGTAWVKIGWRVDTDGKNGTDTTVYGWVKMPKQKEARVAASGLLSTATSPIQMNTAKFTTVTDSVSVRQAPSSGAKSVFKLDKGVEVKISAIELVGEDIWGYQIDEISQDGRATGWVNLSSKYFTRNNLPTETPDVPASTGKVATVVNTDTVNVRKSASLSGTKIGSLKRGTTANVLEIVGDWYNLDIDVDNNPKTGSWVFKDYLDVKDGSAGSGNGSGAAKPVTTGIGIVANTYAGVNVRNGAGTGYALLGKLLPGTQVEILEMKTVGSSKWGRMEKGWVCMDYITMLTEDTVYPTEPGIPGDSGNGTPVGSYDEIDKTTTTAVYTGHIKSDSTLVYATTDHHGKDQADADPTFAVRTLHNGDPVTIYELISVTERIDVTIDDDEKGDDDGHGSTTEKVITTYWARTNDGYIYNPQDNLVLDALDEQVHTVTGVKTLNVRAEATVNSAEVGELKQGDQVKVTALEIEKDKVWGRIEFKGEDRWIRLDYTSEGAYYVPETPEAPPAAQQPPKAPVIGDDGNTGDGGFVNNGSGYRYTGKVINTNSVNVRATASTSAKITTTLKSGAALVIYETTISDNMAWGRCDAGWVYLYYVDLTPCVEGAVDARVVYQDNTIIYSDANKTETVGTYGRMSVIDIYEIVGKMARTDLGWVDTDNLL